MSTATKLATQRIVDLIPYSSAARIMKASSLKISDDLIYVNANELPNNLTNFDNLNRYPQFQSDLLLTSYSQYCQLSTDNILITRGADEGIEILIRTFCDDNDTISYCPPTYDMYKISALTCGIKPVEISRNQDLQIIESIENNLPEKCKLLFICNPENPLGYRTAKQKLLSILDACINRTIVVIDEAYIEFCLEHSVADLIDKYDNLVVLRTLSKAFGLAGLRCGFTLGHPDIIELMQKVIAPYPIPQPVEKTATIALSKPYLDKMHKNVLSINQTKKSFVKMIEKSANIVHIFPSDTNFVTIKFHQGEKIWQILEKNNIIARSLFYKISMADCIRFSIGSENEMTKIADILLQN